MRRSTQLALKSIGIVVHLVILEVLGNRALVIIEVWEYHRGWSTFLGHNYPGLRDVGQELPNGFLELRGGNDFCHGDIGNI